LGGQFKLIEAPTASQMGHQLMNPNIYHRILGIPTLDSFAEIVDAPADWEAVCDSVLPHVERTFLIFANLPERTSEAIIEMQFASLVTQIAVRIRMLRCLPEVIIQRGVKVIVGGFLAYPGYDLRSEIDVRFVNENDVAFLATEVKTAQTFTDLDWYYRDSRGIQTFAAMYANFAPTLLFTQKQFKLVVENRQRTQIFTFPFGYIPDHAQAVTNYLHASATAPMNRDFLKIIVIALLARRPNAVETALLRSPELGPRNTNRIEHEPARRSDRIAKRQRPNADNAPIPTFVSGLDDPIEIRVMPEDEVDRIEKILEGIDLENLNNVAIQPN
jgi:hypothetical protein